VALARRVARGGVPAAPPPASPEPRAPRAMTIALDGEGLSCEQVEAVAREGAVVEVTAAGIERARAAHRVALEVAAERPVYGVTTGAGANRTVPVGAGDVLAHGLRVLRSHAGGAGPLVDRTGVRAMLVVRLNQLAAGGSGVEPALLGVLERALNRGLTPRVARYGAIGTADLVALASTALCIIGERPWEGGSMPAHAFGPTDALAFISSNAATVGEAALACQDLRRLLQAGLVVAALSFVAVDGSPEPYAAAVHESRRHPGQIAVAARMRELLRTRAGRPARRIRTRAAWPARRVQDPFGLRALPQVHGAALDGEADLERVLAVEMNSAGENPLVDVGAHDVLHNGNFHAAYLALALDKARAALFQTAALSVARLSGLADPANTGLRPFLADGPEPSSGVTILEYVAHSALADLRHQAAPATLGSAVLAAGLENHASFSAQAAWRTTEALEPYESVLACELLAAVRALRLQGVTLGPGPLREAYELAGAAMEPGTEDRPLEGDLKAAIRLLPDLARA
jgi:histidine ammonia-lyase